MSITIIYTNSKSNEMLLDAVSMVLIYMATAALTVPLRYLLQKEPPVTITVTPTVLTRIANIALSIHHTESI